MTILEETSSRLVLSFTDVRYSKTSEITMGICWLIIAGIFILQFIIHGGNFKGFTFIEANILPMFVLFLVYLTNLYWLGRQKKFFIFDKSLNKFIIQCKCPFQNRYTVGKYCLDDIDDVKVEERSYSGVYGIGSLKHTVVISVMSKLHFQTDEYDTVGPDKSYKYMENIALKINRYLY